MSSLCLLFKNPLVFLHFRTGHDSFGKAQTFWILTCLILIIGFQTANLDGETNLKIRKALEKTWDYVTPEKAFEFKGFCHCG